MLEELEELLDSINTQIQYYKDMADKRRLSDANANYLKIQDPNGTYVVSPLLVAKAQCITAILALKKEMPDIEEPKYFRCAECDGALEYDMRAGDITPGKRFSHIKTTDHEAIWDRGIQR